jgi:hypothetical protein
MKLLNWNLFIESVGKHKITNFDDYADGLGLSVDDKLYFLNKINPDVIVDFGCADGYILEKIKENRPNIKLIGYDLDSSYDF